MTAVKIFLAAAAGLLTAGVLKPCCKNPAGPPRPVVASYVQRGDLVQQHYRVHNEHLQSYYESLRAALKLDAPDLLPLIEAPKPPERGYQVLPNIITRAPSSEESPRPPSAWYSWPWTDQLISSELKKITGLEVELQGASALSSKAMRSAYEKLARSYSQIRAAQKNLDAHIQYNRLWQAAIALDRSGYDEATVLHNAVLERQSILEALNAGDKAVFKHIGGFNQIITRQMESGLVEREKLLARDIHNATDDMTPASFVRIECRSPHSCVFHVPFYTDIDDQSFVQSVKDTIEKIWHVRDGDAEFGVELEISLRPANELYRDREPPLKGDRIDTARHLTLFPPDRAVLTTGGPTTHVYSRGIVLGPHDLASAVLAHEFGHILGFRDTYFRGYRDLGSDGFQVMEVVTEPNDIMGAPGRGRVLRRHFERILGRYAQTHAEDPIGYPRKEADEKSVKGIVMRKAGSTGLNTQSIRPVEPRLPHKQLRQTSLLPPREAATIATMTTSIKARPTNSATVESIPNIVSPDAPDGPGAPAGP